jgi:Lon protease-like protein
MILPLNVFEPRYLELVEHVTEMEHPHIGVPLLMPRAPGDDGPRVFERVFGVGKLVMHKALDDGRRFIRLEGVGRARMLKELEQEHLFRRCAVEVLSESAPQDHNALEVLKAQVERIGGAFSDDDKETITSILGVEDPRVLTYILCALVPNIEPSVGGEIAGAHGTVRPDLALQQRCLDEDDCDARISLLLGRASAVVERLVSTGRLGMSVCN